MNEFSLNIMPGGNNSLFMPFYVDSNQSTLNEHKNNEIYLIDEIHTPDSSRYFYLDGYEQRQENGEKQKQLSKEFVREWLMENGFQGKDGQKSPNLLVFRVNENLLSV